MRTRIGVVLVAALVLSPVPAAAAESSTWGSVAVDFAGLGSTTGSPRSDFASYLLMTPRYHVAAGEFADVSVGLGVPVFHLLLASYERSPEFTVAGLGVTAPLTLSLYAAGHGADGFVISFGGSGVISTAYVCALAGSCTGRKEGAGVAGIVGEVGLGYSWANSPFFRASYENGRLASLGHAGGEPPLEGMYQGAGLTVGFTFGR
jgi:hypothetical protein